MKFTVEISETETTFLDTTISKGERFLKDSVLDIRTHFKPTETFQYTHFSSSHPPRLKKRFHQRRGSKISQNKLLLENNWRENQSLQVTPSWERLPGEANSNDSLRSEICPPAETKRKQTNLAFCYMHQPSVPNLKQILMKKWHLIEKQPLLSELYRKPPLISYKRGRSLKDILVSR